MAAAAMLSIEEVGALSERVLDEIDVLERGDEPHHLAAAEDQGLAVPPALGRHRPILRLRRLPLLLAWVGADPTSVTPVATAGVIDRERSAARIERDIEHLATAPYTRSSEAIPSGTRPRARYVRPSV